MNVKWRRIFARGERVKGKERGEPGGSAAGGKCVKPRANKTSSGT